jgi:hypothetical protein
VDELRQRLERIQSEIATIPPDVLEGFLEQFQRHSYSVRLDARHSVRSILSPQISCSNARLVVLSGSDETNNAGKITIRLDRLLCATDLVVIREPYFVATPHESVPVFVTAQIRSARRTTQPGEAVTDGEGNQVENFITNLEVDILSWKHDGTSAARTMFAWICTIEVARYLFIGG